MIKHTQKIKQQPGILSPGSREYPIRFLLKSLILRDPAMRSGTKN